MIPMKKNCWEFKHCGRQPGGDKVKDFGICPASTEQRLNYIHGGRNAGRACWVVTGTFCKGEVQGSFAQKYRNCEACDFFRSVREDEHPNFKLSASLLSMLR